MSSLTIPREGVSVLHDRADPDKTTKKDSPQIIQLNLVDNITQDILKSLRNHEQVRLKFGRKPNLTFGKQIIQLDHARDEFPCEVFSGPPDGSKSLYFSGKLSHILEVQQAQQATAGTDAALATLSNTLKSLQEERASNEAGLVASRFSKKDKRPAPLGGRDRLLAGSGPASPFVNAGFSPRLGPTSAPMFSGTSTKDKIRLDAVKIPMIHLLAVNPATPQALAEKLRVGQSDCDRVLEKISREAKGSPGKKELKDKSYRDLDVWKFRYPSQNDRQSAIDHAVSAFDRMRIDKTDPLWQMLLAKEDRGKGINLSRLNFDKPITVGNLTPKIPERSTDGSTESKSVVSEQDGQGKKGKENPTKTIVSTQKKVAAGDVASKPKPSKEGVRSHTRVDGGNDKATALAKSMKQHETSTKYKSAERIEDSDEEAEGAETIPAAQSVIDSKVKRKEQTTNTAVATVPTGKSSPPTPRPTKTTSSSNPPLHKPRTSNASSSSTDINQTNISSAAAKQSAEKQPQKSETFKTKASPRSRTNSSPQKPSPLGSSPPTNFTDGDNSSISSKAQSQDSSPLSPPSSTDSAGSRRHSKYSPVISESAPDRMANGVHKRKAEPNIEQPAPKRQQANGNRFNSLPKGLSEHVSLENRVGPGESHTPSPEKQPLTKDEVVDSARRFQKYYNKYKNLHDRLLKVPEKDRDDVEVDKVWTMHVRLEEMKADIWKDWERLQ